MHTANLQLRMVPVAQSFVRSHAWCATCRSSSTRRPTRHAWRNDRIRQDHHRSAVRAVLHLVRNALDHGIESPRERRSAGKADTAPSQWRRHGSVTASWWKSSTMAAASIRRSSSAKHASKGCWRAKTGRAVRRESRQSDLLGGLFDHGRGLGYFGARRRDGRGADTSNRSAAACAASVSAPGPRYGSISHEHRHVTHYGG